ncbi:transposase [Candidatus Peregrinibacteria bacterium]|nr:transposase [Candidatus Peregrinibacteria bacterium]
MRPPRIHLGQDGTAFFVTTVTKDRTPFFSDKENAKIAEGIIRNYQKRGDFWLIEYVIMPDHVHLAICPHGKSLSQCMQYLKRTISQKIHESVGPKYFGPTISGDSLWQHGFHDMIIHSIQQLHTMTHYIYQNPVKAGLCEKPEDYVFSSINKPSDRHRFTTGLCFPDQHPPLVVGTTNRGKILEIQECLRDLPIEIINPLDLHYIEDTPHETGDTFEANAIQKARFYFDRTGLPTLADDSGIIVEALKKELGIHTRRWGAGPQASDKEWIDYFLKRMKKEKDKRARFVCVLCYIDKHGKEHLFEGTCDGVITETLEADYVPGLPISACFKTDGQNAVFSALSIEQKNSTSHRGRALTHFRDALNETLEHS